MEGIHPKAHARGTPVHQRIVLKVSKAHHLLNKTEYQVFNTCGCITYRTHKALNDTKASRTGLCLSCYRKIHSALISQVARDNREKEADLAKARASENHWLYRKWV